MTNEETMEDVSMDNKAIADMPKQTVRKKKKTEENLITELETECGREEPANENETEEESFTASVEQESSEPTDDGIVGLEPEDDNVIGYEPEEVEDTAEDENEGISKDDLETITNVVAAVLKKSGMFHGRKVNRATKEQRKNMYVSESEVVSSKSERIMTDKDYLKQESDILMTAAVSKSPRKILSGKIVGFGNDAENIMCAKIQLDNTKGKYKVLIPVSYLFPFDYEKEYGRYGAEKGASYFSDELVSRIGGHITFTITKVLEKEQIAYGCRLEAMAIEAYGWYKHKQEDGEPKLKNGLKAIAEVISVRDDRLKVYVLGAEATIKTKELSWTSLGLIRDEFHMGDKFAVCVDHITDNDYNVCTYKDGKVAEKRNFKLVNISASKRKAEPEPKNEYFKDFEIGNLSGGIITNIDGGKIFVSLYGKMDCVCNAPAKGVPAKGVACVVEITQRKEKEKLLYGKIRSME